MKLKHKTRVRKGFSLVELLVVIAIIAGLAAMSFGPIINKIKESKKANAISNARNIFAALQGYALNNGGLFPSVDTARTGDDGSSAEGCWTMLINDGQIENEELFWNAQHNDLGTTRAAQPDLDGVVDPGENAWGYVSGLSNSSRPSTPIIFDASDTVGTFNTSVWDGFAIVGKLDGSVKAMRIAYTGKPLNDDGSGKTGAILEKRGTTEVDLFTTALPGSTTVLPASGGGS